MKKLLIVLIALMMPITMLVSCGKTEKAVPKSELSGYWQGKIDGSGIVMYFDDNGTGKLYYILENEAYYSLFDWSKKGEGKIYLAYTGENGYDIDYSVSGDKLTFDGQELERASEKDVPEKAVDLQVLQESLKG